MRISGRGVAAIGRWAMGGLLVGMVGCASPGRPLPPSLRLPAPVTDLRAARVGDGVELGWTTPTAATDGVALKGGVRAELCRDAVTAVVPAETCTVVRRWTVAPGATAVVDVLPAGLTVDPAGALVYRLRLKNAAGKDAGPSNAAYAASGQAPEAIGGLEAGSVAAGVRLRWTVAAGPRAAVEMVRTTDAGVVAASASGPVGPGPIGRRKAGRGVKVQAGAAGAADERGVSRLAVDAAATDPGGAIDATAGRDREYRYMVTRVRTVRVAGRELTLRGPASAAVVVRVQDMAAPAVPKGLVAAADGLRVALSWEPGFEADLAGYRVYRAGGDGAAADGAAGTWERLDKELVTAPSFDDVLPREGEFRYRVTAVDAAGNESAASEVVGVRAGR